VGIDIEHVHVLLDQEGHGIGLQGEWEGRDLAPFLTRFEHNYMQAMHFCVVERLVHREFDVE
jgi:hypothetical protein